MFIYYCRTIASLILGCFLFGLIVSFQAYAGNEKLTEEEIEFLVKTTIEAGKKIQENWLVNRVVNPKNSGKYTYKEPDMENEQPKGDSSSVTSADKESEGYITKVLSEHETLFGLPRLSEESEYPMLDHRGKFDRYILIDPLDGTSKFKIGEIEKVSVFIVVLDKVDDERGGAKPIFSIIHRPFDRNTGDIGEGLVVEDGVTIYGGEDYGVRVRRPHEPEYTLGVVPTIFELKGRSQAPIITVTDSSLNPRLSSYLQRLGCNVEKPKELSAPLFTVDFPVEQSLERLPSVSKFFAMTGLTKKGEREINRQDMENIYAHICLNIQKDKESDQTQDSWATEEVDVAVMHGVGIPLGIHFYDMEGNELRYNKRPHLKMGHTIGLPIKPEQFREVFSEECWSTVVIEGEVEEGE